ncbi:hypothetical protein [Legionella londiniensis]|uniref:Transmembrane protein n=1 Tax=Legionella londiniensis TaxID=45068 RepID=A0A0W0VNM6_9GAMM|nr:hypothetical protein [Legionella londiniensis]KTD21771.1 hypothetical protein Llon_0936 [Legionella londiniensis]STX92147.1 Uncharacterised protein [Legionella londiniensis]
MLAKQLRKQQSDANKHQKQLGYWCKKNKLLLASLLIPAFLIGWYSGNRKRGKKFIKQLSRLMMLAASTAFKKSLANR